MAHDKLAPTDKVHLLFKAFYDHGLPNKKDLCDELRYAIANNIVSGRGEIQKELPRLISMNDGEFGELANAMRDLTDLPEVWHAPAVPAPNLAVPIAALAVPSTSPLERAIVQCISKELLETAKRLEDCCANRPANMMQMVRDAIAMLKSAVSVLLALR